MYLIQTKAGGYGMLIEKSNREGVKLIFNEPSRYRRVDAAYAHRWVRDGGQHMTALWIDQGRVRRA